MSQSLRMYGGVVVDGGTGIRNEQYMKKRGMWQKKSTHRTRRCSALLMPVNRFSARVNTRENCKCISFAMLPFIVSV